MYKEFTARGSNNWLNILPMIIDVYNNSKHRTIGMTPIEADNNPAIVRLNHDGKPARKKNKFIVGDYIRISTHKGVFTKGYLPNWSTEIFTINKINNTLPTTYMLKDYTGNPIAGCFYSEELNKTQFPKDYLVEKVVRTKGEKVFVKWLGFDTSHNSWINKNAIKK